MTMFHAECKPRYHESQDTLASEPSSKRMKSTEEPYGKSYEGLQRLYEEIHVKKTHSGFIPLSTLSDDEEAQEHETTKVLNPFKEEFRSEKTLLSESSNSINNNKFMGNKCIFFTNSADVVSVRENNTSSRKHKNEGETEVYSTSKAFIGPIYKSEADCQHDKRKKGLGGNYPKLSNAALGRNSKREMVPKQGLPCDLPKIEDELSQFYSEINQLESDENQLDDHLQRAEADSHGHPGEYNKWNQITCVNSQDWSYSRTSPNCSGDGQCFYNASGDHKTHSEQYPYYDPKGPRTGNSPCFDNERKEWETGQLCNNKQAGSRFFNESMPQFRPGWQHTHPLIIPCGPPPPQFTPFNFQEPNSSSRWSDIYPSNVGPFENTHINMSSSAFEQNSECTGHFGVPNTQNTRNGCNVPDGHVDNGFYEAKACWKDIKTHQTEGLSSVSYQFLEGKLFESQKLLLILRGLPGSGKTSLSRILLGQSHDGIVFSTDDYFRQQDGCWSYNIGQLGAAHDWNQKRAKQAMDQGKSPIIIDNTNTQAWEMKPYVEAALEKGYKVEFLEPNTWWKFDPGELEKRNEHGVSREKIFQMLERYEYQMSIPIVMNSVLPFHKTSQRPPPQRRQREAIVKKKHRLHKMKQRRRRKRNKKMKGAAIKAMEKNSGVHLTPSDEPSQSGVEESEDDGKSEFETGYPNEPKEGGENGTVNDDLKPELQKGKSLVPDSVDPETLDNSLKMYDVAGDAELSLSVPSVPNESITEQSFGDDWTDRIQSNIIVESKNNILERNKQSSTLKLDSSSKETSAALSNVKGKTTSTKTKSELGAESKQLDDVKEVTISCECKTSTKNETNTWAFFSCDLADRQAHTSSDKTESCLTWSEGTSEVKYEQRPKKMRRPKQIFSEKIEQTDYTSKKLEREGNGEALHGDNGITDFALPLPLTMNIQKLPRIEMGGFSTESVTSLETELLVNIHPSNVNIYSSRKKGRCKRIFKLAPNFDRPRQIAVRKDEKVLKDINLLMQQEETSNKVTREKNKQNLCCHERPAPSSCNVIVESPPHFDVKSLCNNSSQLAEESVDSLMTVAASPIKKSTPVPCEAPLPSEGQTVAFDQTVQINTVEMGGGKSPDVSTTQPDILHSVKETAECLANSAAENSEQTQRIHETEPTKCSQIGDDQDPLNTKPYLVGLPLSLGFALQLVERFGSPGVPLDNLLPDDYVVPLDWATSKEIHLQWKTSVEKKQKNFRSKEDNSLPVNFFLKAMGKTTSNSPIKYLSLFHLQCWCNYPGRFKERWSKELNLLKKPHKCAWKNHQHLDKSLATISL
ncbi:uncharacterized protein LOC128350654 isoform X3 [Hemicordylus capensis]|uniref:uncharacterized protein LOC128350654 isoform X3 n=1 Tax=Hemicordylus capensis TaxID=884348 RepID=UPI002303CDD3|nr:uncharacterized protein LOC128350654 isoform X3 [Hemicordylus capensis]